MSISSISKRYVPQSVLRLVAAIAILLAVAVLTGSNPGQASTDSSKDQATASDKVQATDETYTIPIVDGVGETTQLQARVCKPLGDGPFRIAVINHGSPSNPSDRPTMRLGHCDQEAAQWFLQHGYAVAFALRRGYGATGGKWAEDYGECAHPHFRTAGLETARDIDAVVNFVTALPQIRPDHAVVVGQSAGGWGTIAYDSISHPKVSTFIVMAGGRGGHAHNQPNANCRPDKLIETAGGFGATARTPMLWIYTDNDTYFAPPLARAMNKAFNDAGGKAELIDPGTYASEGHHLFFGRGGSLIWGPVIENFISHQ